MLFRASTGFAVVLLLLLILGVGSAAAADWGARVQISRPDRNAFAPSVAVGPNGRAVVAWTILEGGALRCCHRVRYQSQLAVKENRSSTFAPAGALEALRPFPRRLQRADIYVGEMFATDVAVNSRGEAVVAWKSYTRPETVRIVTTVLGQPVSPHHHILGVDHFGMTGDPSVGLLESGAVAVAWPGRGRDIGSRARAVVRSSTQPFAAGMLLRRDGCCPHIAGGGDRFVVAWRTDHGIGWTLSVHGGGWAPPAAIRANRAGFPAAATGGGQSLIGWQQDHPRVGGDAAAIAAIGASGETSKPMLLSTPGRSATPPQPAVGSGGHAAAVWREFDFARRISSVHAVTLEPDHAPTYHLLGSSAIPESHISFYPSPAAAVAPDGTVVVVWLRPTFHTTRCCATVQAAMKPAGGNFGAAAELAPHHARAPRVSVGPEGDVLAVWERFDGHRWVIEGSTTRVP
jgi:hypothetical protein